MAIADAQDLAGLVTRLETRPDDDTVVESLAAALGEVEPAERQDALQRAEAALDGHAAVLAALGTAVFRKSWPGCELAGARLLVAALRIDPRVAGAVSVLVGTFYYLEDYDEIWPVVEDALALTDRAPEVLTAWARWLAAHERADDAQQTIHEAVDRWITRLTASPGDVDAAYPFAEALGDIDEPQRRDALERVRDLLADRADELVVFAGSVRAQTWPGCELAAARLVVAALRTGADAQTAVAEIVADLGYIDDVEAVAPVVEEALQLTDRDPALAANWSIWLAAHDREEQARELAQEVMPGLVTGLAAEPYDVNAANLLAAALGAVDPAERAGILQRAWEVLAARPDDRLHFGASLFSQRWPGCELASARWLLDALREGADARYAVPQLASALSYIADFDDASSVVDDALELTEHDPWLLAAWSRWLDAHERSGHARAVAHDAVQASEARLRADPEDQAALAAMTDAFPYVDQSDRLECLRRVEGLLQEHGTQLVALGRAVGLQGWPGSEPAAVRLFVAALRADPQNAQARAGIVDVVNAPRTAEQEDIRPLVEEALEITGREPTLLAAWAPWLLADEQLQAAQDVALEYLRRGDGALLAVHGNIADYFLARRRHADAAHWLDRVEALAEADVTIILPRAQLERQQGQAQRAIAPLRAVLLTPDMDDTYRWRVVDALLTALADLGRSSDILDDLSRLEENGDVWSMDVYRRVAVLDFRARVALLEGDAGAAQRWLELAVEAVGDPQAWNIAPERLALLALQGKERLAEMDDAQWTDFRAACALLSQALHRLPLRAQALARAERAGVRPGIQSAAHFEVGLELADLEHYAEAQEAYRDARAAWTEPPLPEEGFWLYGPYSLHNTATALESEGKYDAAVDTWRAVANEYATLTTDDPYLAWANSIALFRLDRLTEAYDACLKGLDADPESIDLLSRLVAIDKAWQASWARRQAETTSEPDSAARELRERLEKSCRWRSRDAGRRLRRLLHDRASESRAAAHHAAYADFLIERSELTAAHPQVLKAVSLDPDVPGNHQLLGRWHEARDEYREAVTAYSRAVDLSPDDHEIHSQLAACHVKLGSTDAARGEFGIALARAPAHVESLIGLADLHVDVAEKSQDDSNYDTAIELYTQALRHHAHGTGSKFLTSAEKAAIFYQRGYCAVQLYEAKPNVLRSRNLLKEALADFRRCLAIDPQHEKARSAQRKLTEKSSPFVRTARERYGPWLIVTCTIFVFVVAQVKYVAGDIKEASHIALTFGSVALAIAGLFLPELLKLKVGGVELEKSPVEQERRPSSFGLSR